MIVWDRWCWVKSMKLPLQSDNFWQLDWSSPLCCPSTTIIFIEHILIYYDATIWLYYCCSVDGFRITRPPWVSQPRQLLQHNCNISIIFSTYPIIMSFIIPYTLVTLHTLEYMSVGHSRNRYVVLVIIIIRYEGSHNQSCLITNTQECSDRQTRKNWHWGYQTKYCWWLLACFKSWHLCCQLLADFCEAWTINIDPFLWVTMKYSKGILKSLRKKNHYDENGNFFYWNDALRSSLLISEDITLLSFLSGH